MQKNQTNEFLTACMTDDVDKIKSMLPNIDIHENDDLGFRVAVGSISYRTIDLLLDLGANINASSGEPLATAVASKDLKLISHLSEKGARIINMTKNHFHGIETSINNDDIQSAIQSGRLRGQVQVKSVNPSSYDLGL